MGLQNFKIAGDLLIRNGVEWQRRFRAVTHKFRLGEFALLGVFFTVVGASAVEIVTAPTPTLEVSPTPSPSPLTAKEKKALVRTKKENYSKARKELRREHDREWKEYDRDLKRQWKEFGETEKQKRRQFFRAHHSGPERRDYIKDFIARREKFVEVQAASRAQKKKDHADAIQDFDQRHKSDLSSVDPH